MTSFVELHMAFTDGHESLHKLAIVFFTLPTHGSLETKVTMPEIGNYV